MFKIFKRHSTSTAMKIESGHVKICLYFLEDLTDISQRLVLNLANEPSWILEIHGLTEAERDIVQTKYDRLRRPPNEEWITGLTPLIDIEAGNVTEFHDVSPFFDTLVNQLQFKPASANLPGNTDNFQPHEVREWKFTK